MAFTLIGSFPNSQIRPTPATQTENNPVIPIPADTVTIVLNENSDRVSATLINEGPTDVRYTAGAENPSAAEGTLLVAGSSIDIDGPEEYKFFASGGASAISVSERIG